MIRDTMNLFNSGIEEGQILTLQQQKLQNL